MKKIILLALTALVMVGCGMAMDKLDVTNGSKYIVTLKLKKDGDYHYTYHLIKEGDKFYDYYYKDTANFNVGDTIVITVRRISK